MAAADAMAVADAGHVYADHAATSWPKPAAVVEAVRRYLTEIGVAPGRGSGSRTAAAERIVARCRSRLAEMFACPTEHLVLTAGGTDSLNLAIRGLVGPDDAIVCSAVDHNAVLRPAALAKLTVVPCDRFGRIDSIAWGEAIARVRPRLACINHASNVTGVVQDAGGLTQIAHEAGVPVLLDACQTAGEDRFDWAATGADLIAASGHKGLLGPLGVGLLAIRGDAMPQPLRLGGTGGSSEGLAMPDVVPLRYEAGSVNGPAIAGLLAAIENRPPAAPLDLSALDAALATGSLSDPVAGTEAERLPTRSFAIDRLSPHDAAAILEASFGVEARAGLHCAPLMHESLGSAAGGGLVRVSFGPMSTQRDVDAVAAALGELAA